MFTSPRFHHAILINISRGGKVLLEVVNISRKYGQFEAVRDFSFTVLPGQVVGLLGQNGAGKSTLMGIIAGYLAPTAGRVSVFGQDLMNNPYLAKHHLGYLPENPPLYQELKVIEYLDFCCCLKGVAKKDCSAHLKEIIQLLEISDVQCQLIGSLSKGYRQRVGLAQALVGDPEILLLDEPTAGFDPSQAVLFRKLISRLSKKKIIIISSHLLSEVEAICDRVLVIHQGQLKLDRLLHSDTLQNIQYRLVVSAASGKFLSALRQLPSVHKTRLTANSRQENTSLLIETKTDGNFPKEVFTLLSGLNAPILELTPLQEKLEDLFMRATAQRDESA